MKDQKRNRQRRKTKGKNSLFFFLSPLFFPSSTNPNRKSSRSLYNCDASDDDPDAPRCRRRRGNINNAAGVAGPSASSAGARSYPLAPALIPTRSVHGHLDWVFGLDWITERHLVTGSRDRTLALWVREIFCFFFSLFLVFFFHF